MSVLMVTGEYPPMSGGISGYTQLLVKELRSQGTNCTVLSHSRSHADHTLDSWSWRLPGQVRSLVAAHKVDVVHIQYQAGAFAMHPAVNVLPRLLGDTPVVTTFHDLRPPYLFPKAQGIRNAAIKRMARWSDAVVVTNPADQRTLAASGIESHVIPLGSSLPSPDAGDDVKNVVGFFGYPSRQKGFDRLVEAVGRIPRESRPSVQVVGSKPPAGGSHGFYDEQAVTGLADRFDVEVYWTGYLSPQVASNTLAASGVIAFPFPGGATLRSSAMIAALQTGRPVISTLPAHPDDLLSLQSVATLKFVPSADIASLARSIETSMYDPSKQTRLPAAFQWSDIAAQHQVLYATVTGKLNT